MNVAENAWQIPTHLKANDATVFPNPASERKTPYGVNIFSILHTPIAKEGREKIDPIIQDIVDRVYLGTKTLY